jgi:methenyltetrahydrofolate cyclohydrolase
MTVEEGMADIPTFLDDLASGEPIPGGGSVAALEVAMAAALLAMVSNLTIGRKKYADVQDRAQAVLEEASKLRSRSTALIDEDAQAYGRVAEALSLPRDTEESKQRRGRTVQAALKGAVAPPLETMRLASRAASLAESLVAFGNSSAASDVGTAAATALAAYRSAELNVQINLASIRDSEWSEEMRREVNGLQDPAETTARVLDRVRVIVAGEG